MQEILNDDNKICGFFDKRDNIILNVLKGIFMIPFIPFVLIFLLFKFMFDNVGICFK
jgi:hypothetical protein